MKLSNVIAVDASVPQLAAKTRDEAIEELVLSLGDAGVISKDRVQGVIAAVLAREVQVTTGIGKGIAVPHAKVKGISKPVATMGCSDLGIDFAALDGQPVYSIILLLSSPDNPDEHLQAMEAVFRHVQRGEFREALRQSRTQDDIADLVRKADESG